MDDVRSSVPTLMHAGLIGAGPINSTAIRAKNGRFALIAFGAGSIAATAVASFTLQDSADNSSWANVAGVSPIPLVDTEVGVTKAFAVDFNRTREYVRVQMAQSVVGNILCGMVATQTNRFRSQDSSPAQVEVL